MDTKSTNADRPEVLFYGCLDRRNKGHFLHSKRKANINSATGTPWGNKLDGGLLRPDPNAKVDTTPSNRVVFATKDGWTALSFWDRSGDDRPASNSSFVLHDEWPVARDETVVARVLEMARQQWPEIFERPGFPLPQFNGMRKHIMPVDDGFYTNTDGVLHCAQLTCWCQPTPDTEDEFTIVHHAKDNREKSERGEEKPKRVANGQPGWIIIGENF